MYTPTNWIDGDIVTEQKLNKLEQGLEDAGCKIAVINVLATTDGADTVYTPDKTFAEVMELIEDGYVPVYVIGNSTARLVTLPTIVFTDPEGEKYGVRIDSTSVEYAHDATGFHSLVEPVS